MTIFGVLCGVFLIGKYSEVFPVHMMFRGPIFFKVGLTIGQFVIAIFALQLIMLNYREEKKVESIALSIVYASAAVIAVILSEVVKGTNIQTWDSIKTFLINDSFLYNILDAVLIQFTLIVFILKILSTRSQPEKSRISVIVSAVTVILGVSFIVFLFLFDYYEGIPVTGGTNYENLIVIITAISGLITAISGLYGQILAGKKLHAEIELLKAQQQSSESSTKIKKKTKKVPEKTEKK